MSALDATQSDVAVFLQCLDAVAGCEPDSDQLRQVLLRSLQSIAAADGAALFEIGRLDVTCCAAVGACAPLQQLRLSRAQTVVGSVTSVAFPVEVDLETAPERRDGELFQDLGFATVLVLPLRRGRRMSGVLLAGYRNRAERSRSSDAMLASLVQVGAARLEHLALASEAATNERLLAEVAEAGRAVLASDTPAQALCDRARELTRAAYASFVEPKNADELILAAQSGADLPSMTLRLDAPSLAGAVFRSGRAHVAQDYRRHPDVNQGVLDVIAGAGLAETRAAAYIPVRLGQQTLGVICLLLCEAFTLQTMTALGLISQLASEAALAIDRDRLRRDLQRQASTDALTTVANRRTYAAQLAHELARAKRSGRPVSLVLVDLDHFKDYNDRHGHQAGDTLLRTVTGHWLAQMRETDLLARLGGDEFAVVLPDTTTDDGLAFSRRLLAVLPDGVTASAGVAEWDGAEDQLAFYRRCDEALYDAKGSGRARVCAAP